MPIDVSRAPATASPLWIIALFIALSEATAGTAAIITDGIGRLIFTYFAVSFPILVFGIFTWLLICHAPKLYAPGQYSSEITPETYRLGLTQTESALIGRAMAETVVPLLPGTVDGAAARSAVDKVAHRFEAAVEEASVSIFLGHLRPGAGNMQIPVDERTNVDGFLDSIFFMLSPTVKPFTYDRSWVLRDKHGKKYSDMGTSWARLRGLESDGRSLAEVGIKAGARLEVVRKNQ
jgi:hypothetical protein